MTTFGVDDTVFVRHPKESWVVGQITAVAPAPRDNRVLWYTVHVADSGRQITDPAPLTGITLADLDHCEVDSVDRTTDDLLTLTTLSDAVVLRCLHMRYRSDIVYTNIGVILVAINPFNSAIPHYSDARLPFYLEQAGSAINDKLMPHTWATAHNTFTDLCTTRLHQSILISGESGAGKTEATKIVMRYLTKISARTSAGATVVQGADDTSVRRGLRPRGATLLSDGRPPSAGTTVEERVTACSPVLEAFGNARTVRNDNSSRFGKLLRVQFDPTRSCFALLGAYTTTYLLEKSRVVTCSRNERVFHSFYLAFRGSDAQRSFGFGDEASITRHRTLVSGGCVDNKEYSTAEDYHAVSLAMGSIGIDVDTQRCVWATAAAVVHQSDTEFEKDGEGSRLVSSTVGGLDTACALWGVSRAEIAEEYVAAVLDIGGKTTRRLLTVDKARDARDALSKAVYEAVFLWLARQCNTTCDSGRNDLTISLLDIFGFEDFEYNSFEQLCINLANETLQNHYNNFIFRKDVELCTAEGISVVEFKFPDNTPCLALIQHVLRLVDDQCATGTGSFLQFVESATTTHGANPFFIKKLTTRDTFGIRHYAADVVYNATGWLEKNRDTLRPTTAGVMRRSAVPFVASLFVETAGSKTTVGANFKQQLNDLMTVINATCPHWIRCIKPHPSKQPQMFGGRYTFDQLQSSGVLGTVRVRKAGYPVRMPHAQFCTQYKAIRPWAGFLPAHRLTADELRAHCGAVVGAVVNVGASGGAPPPSFCQIGRTLAFLKADAYVTMERRRAQALKAWALSLQRVGRGLRTRRRAFRLRCAAVWQRVGRGLLARALLFALFCERQREAILARRRQLAEETRRREAIERAAREQRLALQCTESKHRVVVMDAADAARADIAVALAADRAEVEARRRSQAQREAEARNRAAAAAAAAALRAALAPVEAAADVARSAVEGFEAEMRTIVAYARWKDGRRVALVTAIRALARAEADGRAGVVAAQSGAVPALTAAASVVARKRAIAEEVAEQWRGVEQRRAARAAAAAARRRATRLRSGGGNNGSGESDEDDYAFDSGAYGLDDDDFGNEPGTFVTQSRNGSAGRGTSPARQQRQRYANPSTSYVQRALLSGVRAAARGDAVGSNAVVGAALAALHELSPHRAAAAKAAADHASRAASEAARAFSGDETVPTLALASTASAASQRPRLRWAEVGQAVRHAESGVAGVVLADAFASVGGGRIGASLHTRRQALLVGLDDGRQVWLDASSLVPADENSLF